MKDLTCLLDFLDDNDSVHVWLVIRHGEKAPLDLSGSFETISLTPQGVRDSLELGVRLRDAGIKISSMISSPLNRCTQTGEYIVKGHGSGISLQKAILLAYPGSFLKYIDTCNRNVSEGVRNVLNLILSQTPPRGSICIVITHDAVIAPLLTFLNDEPLDNESNGVGYLDGFAICSTHKNWKIIDGLGMVHDVTPQIKMLKSI